MKKLLLGNKIGMTSIWDKKLDQVPVTVLEMGPCYVIQQKKIEKEGYRAVQIGYKQVNKEKNLTKAEKGHQKSIYEKEKNVLLSFERN